MSGHFSPALFSYLRDLKANNDKVWFDDNKQRFEDVLREPAIQFILDFGPRLGKVSRHFRADPRKSGGSLFRIYVDRRFNPEAPPYKTHCGIQFRHDDGKDAHAPGIYLHLEPGGCFLGLGSWRPGGAALKAIRASIDDDPAAWTRAAYKGSFAKTFDLAGESLKTRPRGVDPDHPMVADLARKDFIGVCDLTQKEVTSADFIDTFSAKVNDGAPFLKWLCGAVDAPF
jgi:uncharacterized protein (TIGR02453 family)